MGLYYAGNQMDFSLREFVDGDRTLFAIIEFIFIIDMIRNFVTEYASEGGKTLNE